MNNFENDTFNTKKFPKLESFENTTHVIDRNPVEVDLDQADRATEGEIELITGFEQSKLIAEIKTPDDTIQVTHTQFPNLEPVIMLLYVNAPLARVMLDPGETLPLGENANDGKCLITLDETGEHLMVYASNPDERYQIFTRELERFAAPSFEANTDDPEIDPEPIYTINRF